MRLGNSAFFSFPFIPFFFFFFFFFFILPIAYLSLIYNSHSFLWFTMKFSLLAGSALLGSALAVDPIVIKVFPLPLDIWMARTDCLGLQILLL